MQRKHLTILIGALALGSTGYLGATWYAGNRIESALAKQDALLKEYPMIKLVERKYQGGFFGASETATYRIGCDTPAPGEDRKGSNYITLKHTISHLPFATSIETRPQLSAEAQKEVTKLLGSTDALALTTKVGFGGKFDSSLAIPAFKSKDADGDMDFKGLNLTLGSDKQFSTLRATIAMPGLNFQKSANESIQLGALNLNADYTRSAEGLYVGSENAELASASFRITDPMGAAQHIEFGKLNWNGTSGINNGMLDVNGKLQLASIKQNGNDQGKLDLDMALARLDAATLQKINESGSIKPLLQCKPMQEPNFGPEQALQLFKHSPTASIKLAFDQAGKALKLDFNFLSKDIKEADLAQGPQALIPKIEATLDGSLSLGLLEKLLRSSGSKEEQDMVWMMANAGITKLQSDGFLQRNGDEIKTLLAFKQGALTLNGKPFNPMQFLMSEHHGEVAADAGGEMDASSESAQQ